MRKVLYLLNRETERFSAELLAKERPDCTVSVVLLQDAVRLSHVPASRVFALSEDVASRKVASPFPSISYSDLVEMIFDADTVVAL
ncbi:MAG: hypothetical protein AB1411_10020 [Nitrospirota bacterium]